MDRYDALALARAATVPPVRRDDTGLRGPTRVQLRSARWRRTSRGLYVPSDVDALVAEQRIREAAAVLPEIGGVTGWAGLRWTGGTWFTGRTPGGFQPVDLATCYEDIRGQPGIRVCQERLPPGELVDVEGVRVTLPVRSLFFATRYARDLRAAVAAVDAAAYSDLVSLEEAWDYTLRHPGWTGVPQARNALALADENTWSPAETAMRLVWVLDACLPVPLTNRPVFDLRGHHLGTPDMIDPVTGLLGEYDGPHHLDGPQRSIDVRRLDAFRAHGLEPVVAMAPDLRERELLAARLRSAHERASHRPATDRSWTLDPPAWWRATHTVDLRRALATRGDDRLLDYRRHAS
ncbi:hypothetical protein [Nocardioides aurantiacus]|uniref:Transcriptional regulator, AbiEi antitoxin, Type IV TA system n=1 Tax=Nocardioides aurantiacus TaxID=86796 RepID=A0A3N2CYP6_9ACTN|nr:hypothetical protein [Nocardioides aurantiacus]ROR92573.1 hypothetical protein EDD33_3464 [Nocardioides aurantiacus]